MRISEDTARVLACSQLIADEKHTSLIRDTIIFAALCLAESPAKEAIEENVSNANSILEKLGVDGDYEIDEESVKPLADKAFSNLRIDVRRIFANAADAAAEYGMDKNYVAGANIAGFRKVVDAMNAQGIV